MNPRKVYRALLDILKPVTPSPEGEARWFIEEIFQQKPDIFLLKEDVENEKVKELFTIVERRVKERIPVQYLFEKAYFMGLEFYITPAVLIPRPETEILVEYVIDLYRGETPFFVDAGTGSGIIAVAVAHYSGARGIAVDIDSEAIRVAEKNIKRYNVDVKSVIGDLLSPFKEGIFDLVVSNPPYVSEEEYETLSPEVKKEPRKALVGGENGYEITLKLMKQAFIRLKPGGSLIIESCTRIMEIITEHAKKTGFNVKNIVKDLNGEERIVHLEKPHE